LLTSVRKETLEKLQRKQRKVMAMPAGIMASKNIKSEMKKL